MPVTIESLGIDRLPVEERLALAEALYASVEAEVGPPELTDELKEELIRRSDEADADPDGGTPWEVVKARVAARYGL